MNELLDGGNLYKEGAQKKFISEYFKVEIKNEASLGYKGAREKAGNIADKQKEKESIYEFQSDNIGDRTTFEKTLFRRKGTDNTYKYFYFFRNEKGVLYFIYSEKYIWNYTVKNLKTVEWEVYIGKINKSELQNSQKKIEFESMKVKENGFDNKTKISLEFQDSWEILKKDKKDNIEPGYWPAGQGAVRKKVDFLASKGQEKLKEELAK